MTTWLLSPRKRPGEAIPARERAHKPAEFPFKPMNPLNELIDVLAQSRQLQPAIEQTAQALVSCLRAGGKVFSCGNGGSGADALHLAEELMGRYQASRRALPALCLNADPALLTCVGNDFGFEHIFARQLEALAQPGDILVGFTTSGNSPNVLAAFATAKARRTTTIFLGGRDGGQARGRCDHELIVPSANTARIQEVHTLILHTWLDEVEKHFAGPVQV